MTVPESPAGAGRFDRLRRGLRRTREGILGRIGSLFRGSARSEDWSGELEEALIQADLGPRAAAQMTECPVQRRVAELRSRAADDDHVRRRIIIRDDRDPSHVLADVAAVQQRAARTRIMAGQVCRGHRRRGEDVVGVNAKACLGQC